MIPSDILAAETEVSRQATELSLKSQPNHLILISRCSVGKSHTGAALQPTFTPTPPLCGVSDLFSFTSVIMDKYLLEVYLALHIHRHVKGQGTPREHQAAEYNWMQIGVKVCFFHSGLLSELWV